MQIISRPQNLVAAVSLAVLAVSVVTAATWAPSRAMAAAGVKNSVATTVSMSGIPTGEFQDGVPVYRLPAIAVVTTRSAELARIAREDRLAQK